MFDLLSSVTNEEKMLDFVLSHICERESSQIHEVADAILTCYIVNEFRKQNKSFTEDDVTNKTKEYIADYLLANLVKKDLLSVSIDEDSDIVYQITEKGRNKIND